MSGLEDFVLDATKSIREAMQLIDKNMRGIVFVTNNRKLIGLATDGDLRRAMLRGLSLDANIQKAMNSDFIALPFKSDNALIRKTFTASLRIIPLCDENGILVDIADTQRSHRIPLMEPDLSGRELEYVTDCINSNWISSQGAYVHRFEEQFEHIHPGFYALAVCNGTVALHMALYALGIGEDDEVIVPDLTFAATINAVLHCRATPVLCEIDSDSLCIDVREAEKLITKKTKAIVPVHLYGQPCNMDAIRLLATKYNLLIIEDCAEALGSRWKGKPVGVFGDASTFSFFGNKTISTGEGGMVLFRSRKVFDHAKVLRDHGMKPGKKYWHEHIGFNYRLTNIQAAIGVAQMERLDYILSRKEMISNYYFNELREIDCIDRLPSADVNSFHSNWLYTIVFDETIKRDSIIEKLLEHGVEARPVFHSLHLMPPYSKYKPSRPFNTSIRISRGGMSLPSSVSLREDELIFVVRIIKQLLH